MTKFTEIAPDRINTSRNKREPWVQRFYESKEWRKLSHEIKKEQRYFCDWCLMGDSKGKGNPGIGRHGGKLSPIEGKRGVVHHIVEIRDDFDLALDKSNIVGICHDCHAQVHNRHKNTVKKETTIQKQAKKGSVVSLYDLE